MTSYTNPIARNIMTAQSLDDLFNAVREYRACDDRNDVDAEVDWSDLPTFGGFTPKATDEVWSWDRSRLMVGTCADDMELIAR